MKQYYVYILSSISRRLYVGFTNDLQRRVAQHKSKAIAGFTQRYNITMLVHYEYFNEVTEANEREKQIKGWLRDKKIALIEESNPTRRDLSLDW